MKLTIGQFLLTAIVPYLVNRKPENWFTESGLAFDVLYYILTVGLFTPIVRDINFALIVKWIIRWRIKSEGLDC